MLENEDNIKYSNENHLNEIKQIISYQSDEIKRIQEFLMNIYDIYNEYINLSKEFSKNLETLAMKLKPDGKTYEGQLVQAFQSILLFNSNSLNEMCEAMDKKFDKEKIKIMLENYDLETFNHFNGVYIDQYNKTKDSYLIYKEGVESYENYLINKELGIIKEDYINNNYNLNESNNSHNKNNLNNNKLFDNHKEVFLNQQKFVNNIRACNDILKNLLDYFSFEKNKMRESIFDYTNSFNENILSCLKKQNETCLNQKTVLDNLNTKNNLTELEEKELKRHFLKPNPYSLKCLKIEEYEEEEKIENENNNLNFKNKLSVEQALHILQTFRNNHLLLNEQDKTKGKEEYNKQEISDILDLLFNKTFLYNDTHKQKLISLLNDKIYQLYFLKLLNKYRTKGKFILNKTALKNLGYLFQYLNEIIIKNEDINLFKLFFIMSLTFYYQDSESFKRYYLVKFVENHQNFKKKKFWEKYLSGLINIDIQSNNNGENAQDINYIIFSNIISITKNMSDFHLGKEFINEFLEDITKSKYNLNDEQKIQINNMLIDSECGSLNENERSTLSTEIYELNQSSFTENSDNNLIRFSRNSSRISNNLLNDTRNSNFFNNMNNSNEYNVNRISNNSNNLNNKLNSIESKNESDEGSLESIDIEEMKK